MSYTDAQVQAATERMKALYGEIFTRRKSPKEKSLTGEPFIPLQSITASEERHAG